MKIGVVKEIKPDEYRVALTPAGAHELVARGHEVVVEHDGRRGVGVRRCRVRRCGRLAGCRRRRLGRRRSGAQGQGAAAGRVRAHPPGSDPLHLPAPRARARADACADRLGGDLHRLRDGRDRRSAAAAAGTDERGRRTARPADGRARARASAGRPRDAARRRRRRRAGEGRRARRRDRRLQRGADRRRDAGRRLDPRSLDRPDARARPDARRARDDRDVDHARGRACARGRRSRDRRRARPGGACPEARDARDARPHATGGRARRRRDRSGRMLRDVASDDPLRSDVRRRRSGALLRGEHARRGADQLDPRTDQRYAPVPRAPRRSWLRARNRLRSCTRAGGQRRRRPGHLGASCRGAWHSVSSRLPSSSAKRRSQSVKKLPSRGLERAGTARGRRRRA